MLTVMCPNCRHRFPAPGCCSDASTPIESNASGLNNGFTNGLSSGLSSGFRGGLNFDCVPTSASGGFLLVDTSNRQLSEKQHHHQVTIRTQCGIQSGGRLIQNNNAEVLLGTSSSQHLALSSKLSGGGCLVQKRMDDIGLDDEENVDFSGQPISDDQQEQLRPFLISEEQLRRSFEQAEQFQRSHSTAARLDPPTPSPAPPSGCQELPGIRLGNPDDRPNCSCCCNCRCCQSFCRGSSEARGRNLCQVAASTSDLFAPADLQIQVNATVRLPATSSCTVNITASTSASSNFTATNSPLFAPNIGLVSTETANRFRNNFHGGGLVTLEQQNIGTTREEIPRTPLSWLIPCPWSFGSGCMQEKDKLKLAEVRRVLQTCGWYHEGLTWQQSENLLKDAPIGRWLMRDSSDSRYAFAISVQTARGPTSVRVFYCMGKFRLDAEPRLALSMPLFDGPIEMLEYYCAYSKRIDGTRQEVWVDYSGQIYSQIFLSEPLVKEMRSLSHLARVAVNKAGPSLEKDREKLPPLIKNYLKEYPYTL